VNKSIVSADSAPAAIGAYSQGVAVGELIFCSGQVGLDPATGTLVEGSVADETRRALTNLAAVLEAAGAGLDRVVKVTAYLTDMGTFPEFNAAYGEFFGDQPPARATIGVAALPAGARVEVECIAHL
jgi:2-iminobutanoate/2-iminopropanoate deaminase